MPSHRSAAALRPGGIFLVSDTTCTRIYRRGPGCQLGVTAPALDARSAHPQRITLRLTGIHRASCHGAQKADTNRNETPGPGTQDAPDGPSAFSARSSDTRLRGRLNADDDRARMDQLCALVLGVGHGCVPSPRAWWALLTPTRFRTRERLADESDGDEFEGAGGSARVLPNRARHSESHDRSVSPQANLDPAPVGLICQECTGALVEVLVKAASAVARAHHAGADARSRQMMTLRNVD